MRPGRQPGSIAVTLRDVRHRPAINLKIEGKIPSKVRRSVDDQLTGRNVARPEATGRGTSLRNSANAHCARKRKNQNNDAGEAVSWFHSTHYTCDLQFRQQIAAGSVSDRSERSENCHFAVTARKGIKKQESK